MRSAIVSRPAVTNFEIELGIFKGNINVTAPGQNISAIFSAKGVNSAISFAISMVAIWAISGLKEGRPLAS